jgi:flagellar export protein FliJ
VSALKTLKEQVLAKKQVMQAELMTRMKRGLSSREAKLYYDYLHHLEGSIERIDENIKAAERQVELKRLELLKAKRESKAIMRLKEIHRSRFDEAERKQEIKFLDEIAIRKAGGVR